MPELPEVASFGRYLEKHALGRKIASAQVKDPRIVRGLPAGEFERALHGRRFTSSLQHGKYLFARTDGTQWVVMHFGMTGRLQYLENQEHDPQYGRLLIRFEEGGCLGFVNPRMLGWVGLTENPYELIARKGLGRSALDRRFDYPEFRRIFYGRKVEVKAALMNQKLVAGIGNIYSDEILFQARVHPKTKVCAITEEKLEVIFQSIGEVLQTAVDRNAVFKDLPPRYLLRDRRKGAGCPVCQGRLETVKAGGRTSYFCPNCQPATVSAGRAGRRKPK